MPPLLLLSSLALLASTTPPGPEPTALRARPIPDTGLAARVDPGSGTRLSVGVLTRLLQFEQGLVQEALAAQGRGGGVSWGQRTYLLAVGNTVIDTTQVLDVAAGAAKQPWIAALLQHAGLTAQSYTAYMVALQSAVCTRNAMFDPPFDCNEVVIRQRVVPTAVQVRNIALLRRERRLTRQLNLTMENFYLLPATFGEAWFFGRQAGLVTTAEPAAHAAGGGARAGGAMPALRASTDATIAAFAQPLGVFAWDGGLLTDELRNPLNGLHTFPYPAPWTYRPQWDKADGNTNLWYRVSLMDHRLLPEWSEEFDSTIVRRSHVRHGGNSREEHLYEGYRAIRHVREVLSAALRPPAAGGGGPSARSEVYALSGYTELMLADLYCSGVPLNRYTAQGVEYQPSSTTAQVYRAALAQFDTALSLADASASSRNLARVGRGRAWLALGEYAAAAAAVRPVPRGFSYALRTGGLNADPVDPDWVETIGTVADRKGGTGLPYVSSGDPRSATEWQKTDKPVRWIRYPAKWDTAMPTHRRALHGSQGDIPVTVTLASWEEAVLIQAEAALQRRMRQHTADRTWLRLLNDLRATAPIPGTGRPDPAALPPLPDPGTDHGRIALLFRERAEWLFLTGHRQGDLRRLVREYHWPQERVYPTGPYITPKDSVYQLGGYGSDVNLPLPQEELQNPGFHGCLDRKA